jgi:hypothetical protein
MASENIGKRDQGSGIRDQGRDQSGVLGFGSWVLKVLFRRFGISEENPKPENPRPKT